MCSVGYSVTVNHEVLHHSTAQTFNPVWCHLICSPFSQAPCFRAQNVTFFLLHVCHSAALPWWHIFSSHFYFQHSYLNAKDAQLSASFFFVKWLGTNIVRQINMSVRSRKNTADSILPGLLLHTWNNFPDQKGALLETWDLLTAIKNKSVLV